MRQKLVGDRQTPAPFRPFQSGAGVLGNRIGFRFVNGRMRSLSYHYLVETDYDPNVGIVLEFVGHRVTLMGRNLTALYEHFEDEAVGEVTEMHESEMLVPADAAFVARIMWERI